MTNSESDRIARTLMIEIQELTDPDRLRRLIDEPIEAAAALFEFDRERSVDHQYFLQVVSDFVTHLYRTALPIRLGLTSDQALGEAVDILEKAHPGGDGYHAAYLEASEPNTAGLTQIIRQMTISFIDGCRQRYLVWVWAARLETADWPLRRRIAQIVLEQWGDVLPPRLAARSPDQLAAHLPALLGLVTRSDRIIQDFLSPQGIPGLS